MADKTPANSDMHACRWTVITLLWIIKSLAFFLTEALILCSFFHNQPSINGLPVINVPLFLFIPQFWCGLPGVNRCVDKAKYLTECNCSNQNGTYCASNKSCVPLISYNESACWENASCLTGKCSISAIFSGLTFTFISAGGLLFMLYLTQPIDSTKFSNHI